MLVVKFKAHQLKRYIKAIYKKKLLIIQAVIVNLVTNLIKFHKETHLPITDLIKFIFCQQI